jgi:hypothetical protein
MSADNSLVSFLRRCHGLVQSKVKRIQQAALKIIAKYQNLAHSKERFTLGFGDPPMCAKQELMHLFADNCAKQNDNIHLQDLNSAKRESSIS